MKITKTENQIAIVAGGPLSDGFLPDIAACRVIIGVDRGAAWLLKRHIVAAVAIGDFDSVSREEMTLIRRDIPKLITYPRKKDQTDLELALRYVREIPADRITLWGVTGGRVDHSLAAAHLLETWGRVFTDLRIRDGNNELFLLPREAILERSGRYRYISFLPLSRSAVITLRGFRYEVAKHNVTRPSTLGISNEFSGKKARVTVHKGTVLAVRSSD
ncbi:thiamine diphosphokinase [Patescibacteria group bacterium]|nr:thiamine diphosphokinase [Patescibacteria group bacterium]